jgi:hypothetical protein
MGKSERAVLIIALCGSAELFESHDDTYFGMRKLIDDFEDIHSPDPYDPSGKSKNRIYGPSKDYVNATEFEGLVEYVHTSHITRIYRNGAFMILGKRDEILLDKPGADGEFCPR